MVGLLVVGCWLLVVAKMLAVFVFGSFAVWPGSRSLEAEARGCRDYSRFEV